MKPRVIVIVGPTASGKTTCAIELAKQINGEIVSADSMQIYEEMNIGTAKVTNEEMSGIKHYMINVAKPDEVFNVVMYKEMAEKAIEEILKKGKVPIVVGGTGLYINTLVNGIEFSQTAEDENCRRELEKRAESEGTEKLYEELKSIDPEAAEIIDKNNVRRVIRALEIYKVTGKTKTELDRESIKETKFNFLLYGIQTDRQELYERINKRIDIMLEQGLIKEVKELSDKYVLSKTALQGLGYKEVLEFINGNCTYNEMVEKLKMETRRYAKRQITWFKRDKRIEWINREDIVSKIVNQL